MKATLAVGVASLALATVLAFGAHFQLLDRIEGDGDEVAIQCMLSDDDEGCTEPLAELKGKLWGVVSTNCGACSDDEREYIIDYFSGLFRRNPHSRKPLQSKYDPTGEYRRKYGKIWRKKGIELD
uniref:Chemosensory protein 4 n=1 Tax=Oedaleus infernalis TaxID=267432 RepID=A0A3G2LGG7_9ORTH|nr:chemosensory protein 4 [Oedaleus infernalis]